ncbi:MAG: ATP-grasp domain-containing protein [Burkholderiales bacterium]|nr:ATP-grasp domain-containing protein [Burkholderiales bacterium]
MIYIFVYNVVGIKSDFTRLKDVCPNDQFILIASSYCLRSLSTKNRCCFDSVYQIARDFHHPNYTAIEQIVQNYASKYGAENLRLMTNEDSAQVNCAKLREFYKIPGSSVTAILPFVNKIISKINLEQVVKLPKFLSFNKSRYAEDKESYLNEIVTKLNFPMFAKPVDLVSSIGTYKIDDLTNLHDVAHKILSYDYEFEIDEFIDGDLFHCDVILSNGIIKFFMAGKYAFHLAKFSKGFPMGSIPVVDKYMYDKLYTFTQTVIKKLRCDRGAYHLELFVEHNTKELVFLEIAARTPGAQLPLCYEIQFNINIEELHYLAHMNLLDNFEMPVPNKFAGWITFPQIEGTVTEISKPHISTQYHFIEYVSVGNNLQNAKAFWRRLVVLFFGITRLKF